MFCIKCGTNNSEEAFYCKKCGYQLEAEEETLVSLRENAESFGEQGSKIFSISPTLLFVKLAYGLAIVGAFLVVALFSIVFPDIPRWVSVLLGILLLLIPAFYHFRQKLVQYTLTDTTIEIDKGIISRTTQNVPLRRVQDVTVSSTIVQRMFRFGDVLIDNASEDGGRIVLKNIDSPGKYADILLKQMRRLER